MLSFIQRDFSGGLNLFDYDHAIGPNQYAEGLNVRTRNNGFGCITAPELDSYAPSGLKQGLYGFGDLLLLCVAGKAYYKYQEGDWTLIGGFSMSKTVSRIYAQAVPATTTGYGRKLDSAASAQGTASDPGVSLDTGLVIQGVDAGVVFQDGINQPFFVYQSGSAAVCRRLNTYEQWSLASREYVPIGKQMAYMNGILFVVSADGKQLYRSVSGRPLDFVVNVDIGGNKGGNATTTSYAVSSLAATGLKALGNGMLLVGTLDGCFPIEFNYESRIFGEPTFLNRRGFAAGLVNQFSMLENLGDLTFIDLDGVRSFNAVSQTENEGRNSVFSRDVGKILDEIVQSDSSCAVSYNNYNLYAVQTTYGDSVLVFDTLRQVWVSVDQYAVGTIKQFAVTRQSSTPKLYAITEQKLYEIYGADSYLEAQVFVRAHVAEDAQQELRLNALRAVFTSALSEATVTAREKSDDRLGASVAKVTRERDSGLYYPLDYPLNYLGVDQAVENLYFNFSAQAKTGLKVGVIINWASEAVLVHHQLVFAESTPLNPLTQKA